MAPDTRSGRVSTLPSAPVVAATSAKHEDQYDDQDNQRGVAHELSLPSLFLFQASPPAPRQRSALTTRERNCELGSNYPTDARRLPQALAGRRRLAGVQRRSTRRPRDRSRQGECVPCKRGRLGRRSSSYRSATVLPGRKCASTGGAPGS